MRILWFCSWRWKSFSGRCKNDLGRGKQNLSEEEQINHPARFALAELENIHHDSQVFEPIHRIITETSPDELLEVLKKDYALFSDSRNDEANPAGFPVECIIGDHIEMIWLDSSKGELAIAILQNFLDQYLNDHPGKSTIFMEILKSVLWLSRIMQLDSFFPV